MSDYEEQRLRNIQRKNELIASLGIEGGLGIAASTPIKPKATAADRGQKRKRPSIPATDPPRRSRRLAGAEGQASSTATRPQSPVSPTPQPVTLRRLSGPAIPPPKAEEDDYDPAYRAPEPTRDEAGTLHFEDAPHFTPNLTPSEMLSLGSFGGTAFRLHYSTVLKRDLPTSDIKEFPLSWHRLLPTNLKFSDTYEPSVNKYRVKAGQSLQEWESAGWIHPQDPRGWFQWYCRFHQGRRTADDDRQIKRWLGVCGPSGRFRRGLVKKLVEQGEGWDDESAVPILRQTIQHWAYRLTEADFRAYL